jgi:hypothetical protein
VRASASARAWAALFPCLLLAGLLLAACGGDDKPPPASGSAAPSGTSSASPSAPAKPAPSGGGFFTNMFGTTAAVSCPRVTKIGEASQLTRFSPSGHDITDVEFEAVIGDINGKCEPADKGVAVHMTIDFIASRGPADKTRKASFGYLVAITDNKENVVARQQFDTDIPFIGNRTRDGIPEKLDLVLPLAPGQRGDDFRIYIGFVVTHDELAYNRAHPQ